MNRAAQRREWKPFVTLASEPYRRADRFAWFFARGKLNMDPVFRHLLGQGLIAPHSRVLDIGCGQGLLASLLSSATSLAEAGRWPLGWTLARALDRAVFMWAPSPASSQSAGAPPRPARW